MKQNVVGNLLSLISVALMSAQQREALRQSKSKSAFLYLDRKRKRNTERGITSQGRQIDTSVVDSYMKSMFFSDFLAV